mgnify:FL=1
MPREEALSYAKEIVINHGVGCTNLHNLLKKTVDEEKVRNSNTDYGLVTTAFPSFKGSYLFIDEIPQGRLHEYLLASASCFPATHWGEIDGQKYIDGGYCDNMPVKMALEKDATNIIAVDLEAVGLLDKGSLKEAASIDGEFKIIKSPWGLGNFLFFSPKNSNYIMNIGYLDTMKRFNRYDGCSYTFKKNTVPPRLISRMDNAAKIFWINPLEIYDQNSFDTALRKNIEVFKASTAIPSVQHMESLKKSTLIGALTALKNRIDRQSLVLIMASNLAAKDSESIFLSRQVFSLLHDEIMAASYIYSKNFF